jgi:hypothetical protein
MLWVAPAEKDTGTGTLEDRLWKAADQLRAHSGLTSAQYSQPVLGLIFLRFAEVRFNKKRATLEHQAAGSRRGSRVDDPTAHQADGLLYLTPKARFDYLLRLPEGANAGKAVNEAMRDIEAQNRSSPGSCRRPTRSSTARCSRACSSACLRSRTPSKVTFSGASTNIFSRSSLELRVHAAASSTHRSPRIKLLASNEPTRFVPLQSDVWVVGLTVPIRTAKKTEIPIDPTGIGIAAGSGGGRPMAEQRSNTSEETLENTRPRANEDSEGEHDRVRSSNDRDQKREREGLESSHNRGYDEAVRGEDLADGDHATSTRTARNPRTTATT